MAMSASVPINANSGEDRRSRQEQEIADPGGRHVQFREDDAEQGQVMARQAVKKLPHMRKMTWRRISARLAPIGCAQIVRAHVAHAGYTLTICGNTPWLNPKAILAAGPIEAEREQRQQHRLRDGIEQEDDRIQALSAEAVSRTREPDRKPTHDRECISRHHFQRQRIAPRISGSGSTCVNSAITIEEGGATTIVSPVMEPSSHTSSNRRG